MTTPSALAQALAATHALCFETPRPWRAAEFDALLAQESTFLLGGAEGFALGQSSGAEAELLTLAVLPALRRAGKGRALLCSFHETALARMARSTLLEVAATNAPAIALYKASGYTSLGTRRAYYRAPDGCRHDALVMGRNLIERGA